MQVNVVDADDFTSMDIDDLLVEEISFQQKEVIQSNCFRPFRSRSRGPHFGIGIDLNHARQKEAVAPRRLDYQPGDSGCILLRTQRYLLHFAHDRSTGVSNARAEKARKCQTVIHNGRIAQKTNIKSNFRFSDSRKRCWMRTLCQPTGRIKQSIDRLASDRQTTDSLEQARPTQLKGCGGAYGRLGK